MMKRSSRYRWKTENRKEADRRFFSWPVEFPAKSSVFSKCLKAIRPIVAEARVHSDPWFSGTVGVLRGLGVCSTLMSRLLSVTPLELSPGVLIRPERCARFGFFVAHSLWAVRLPEIAMLDRWNTPQIS